MSLDTVELIYEIENYFRVNIPDTVAEQMYTVQDIADGVCRLLGIGPAAEPSAVQAATLATLQRELQAVRQLLAPPAAADSLGVVIGADQAAWLPPKAWLAARAGWRLPALSVPRPHGGPTGAGLPWPIWRAGLFPSTPRSCSPTACSGILTTCCGP
jgi:hypothetical protein